MKASQDLPVTLHVPLKEGLRSENLREESRPTDVAISVKSDIMDSYENGWPFNGKDETLSLVHKKEGLINFSIGTDGRLYLIKKDKDGNMYWENNDISAQLIDRQQAQNEDKKYAVTTFNAIHSDLENDEDDAVVVMCCVAEVDNPDNYEIWVTSKVEIAPDENSQWQSLGKIDGVELEFMRLTRNKNMTATNSDEFVYIACGRKIGNSFVDSYMYIPGDKEWRFLQFGYDIDTIVDLQFGVSPISGFGAYVLGDYKERGRFIFVGFYLENGSIKTNVNDIYNFKNPAAFITDVIDDMTSKYYGCSDVYVVDAVEDQKNQIKYMSAEVQDTGDNSRVLNDDIINIGNSFKGSVRRIFLTKNKARRIDLYTHVKEDSAGFLLHTFNTGLRDFDEAAWCPVYILEKNISYMAPASNSSGRICEVFLIGDKSENLHYMWQDDKLHSWDRDIIRVKATGEAVATKCAQTQITFTDAKKDTPIIFQQYTDPLNITIEASKSVNLQINDKKYVLNAHEAITIDAKKITGDLTLITNIEEADSPYYKISADFIENGELIVHPVAKVQDEMAKVDNKMVQHPKDRFGDDLKIKLVEGERATDKYLNGVLPGVNKLASYTGFKNIQNNIDLLSNKPDPKRMKREGVWFTAKGTKFDTRVDLSAIPDGILFAVDFSGTTPVFLNSEECRERGITGIEGYDGFWDDLAHFFGSLIEAVKNTFEKVVHFIVEKVKDVLVFTIEFLAETVRCVVEFAEQVMETIDMVLVKYLGIDLYKILQWLGAIFHLDYILAVQKEIAAKMTRSIDQIREGAQSAEEKVTEFFEKIKGDFQNGMAIFADNNEQFKIALKTKDVIKVKSVFVAHAIKLKDPIAIIETEPGKQWIVEDAQNTYTITDTGKELEVYLSISVPKDMRNMTMDDFQQTTDAKADTQLGKTPEERAKNEQIIKDRQSSMKCDPVLNWPVTQFKHLPTIGIYNIADFHIEENILERLISFFVDELQPIAESSVETWKKDAEDFIKYLQDPSLTLLEIFEYLGNNIVRFGLDIAGKIIVGFLKVVEELLRAFETVMTTELDIPVIKQLFKLVCGRDVPFNIINATALIIAVPATIFCKLAGVKLPTDADANKKPEWWFHVSTWGGLVAQGVQDVVSGIGIAANWVTSVDPSGEAGKLLGNIIRAINTIIVIPCKLWLYNPYFYYESPQTDIDLADTIAVQIHWWTKVIDCVLGQVLVCVTNFIPAIANKVIDIVITSVAFCLYFIEDLAIMIIKIIKNSIDLDIWKIVDSILAIGQKTLNNLSRMLISIGNILPAIEPVEIIAKAILHGSAGICLCLSLGDQTVRAIGNSIHYYDDQDGAPTLNSA